MWSNDTNFLYELRENEERRIDNGWFKHKREKPSGFETLCHQDPSCPVNCNVCCMLPYHTKTGKFVRDGCQKKNYEDSEHGPICGRGGSTVSLKKYLYL